MRKKVCATKALLFATFLLGQATAASAFDWVADAKVTVIEGSYLPTQLNFQIDAAAGSCAAGSWLFWNVKGTGETARNINIQGVYALLMTAYSTGKTVRFFGNNAGCTVDFIWIK